MITVLKELDLKFHVDLKGIRVHVGVDHGSVTINVEEVKR